MALDLSDLNSLDFNNIGSWPAVARAGVIALFCAAVLGLGYWFDTRTELDKLAAAEKDEGKLKLEFEAKYSKGVNLDAYKQQMTEMEESFGTMLRQLPSKTEVADLLVDITQTGLAAGLEFELFRPRAEVPKEFYAELPITLRVRGSYHEFGRFVSGVAALPRIVTLHDISISGKDNELTMDATAKTYRYLDDEELAAQSEQGKKKGRR